MFLLQLPFFQRSLCKGREREGMLRRYEGIVKREQNETPLLLKLHYFAFVSLNKYLMLEKSPTRAHLSLHPPFFLPSFSTLAIIHSLSLSLSPINICRTLLNFRDCPIPIIFSFVFLSDQ